MKIACCSTAPKGPDSPLKILTDVCKELIHLNEELCKSHTKSKCRQELISLKCVDRKLRTVLCSCDPGDPADDLESNFGVNMKLELKQKEREGVRKRLEALKTEWYMQVKHMNKLSKQLSDAEKELEMQSVYCTNQGLILSRLLWKVMKLNGIVEYVTENCEEHLQELIRIVDGCIYGFIKTFRDDIPNPEAEEYQYIVALCGLLTNLSSVPDGRHFLMNNNSTLDLYNLIIQVLPQIASNKATDLQWLMLISIYNIMVNPLGVKYTARQKNLVTALSHCLTTSKSLRIRGISLAIIKNLVEDINDSQQCQFLFENLPIEHIIDLCRSKAFLVSKFSKIIVTKLAKAFDMYRSELLLRFSFNILSKSWKKDGDQRIKQRNKRKIEESDSSKIIKCKVSPILNKSKDSTIDEALYEESEDGFSDASCRCQAHVRTTMPPNGKFTESSSSTKIKISSASVPINRKLRKDVHINDSDKLNILHAQEPCTDINEQFEKCPALKKDEVRPDQCGKNSVTTIFKTSTTLNISGDLFGKKQSPENCNKNLTTVTCSSKSF